MLSRVFKANQLNCTWSMQRERRNPTAIARRGWGCGPGKSHPGQGLSIIIYQQTKAIPTEVFLSLHFINFQCWSSLFLILVGSNGSNLGPDASRASSTTCPTQSIPLCALSLICQRFWSENWNQKWINPIKCQNIASQDQIFNSESRTRTDINVWWYMINTSRVLWIEN